MTPVNFEQFGYYRQARDKIFVSWLRAFELMHYPTVRLQFNSQHTSRDVTAIYFALIGLEVTQLGYDWR
jgi:hypothetical protein